MRRSVVRRSVFVYKTNSGRVLVSDPCEDRNELRRNAGHFMDLSIEPIECERGNASQISAAVAKLRG